MSLGTLAESQVHSSLWELKDEVEIGHIQLSRAADFVLVCPATADLLAKMAAGIADDLATTLLLATDKPVVVAPAMNVRMWQHAATQRNIAQLKTDGVRDHRSRRGRDGVRRVRSGPPARTAGHRRPALRPAEVTLAGKHILVTAGPTHEPIDPVRVIANRSSGRQGFAIAGAAADAGREGDAGRWTCCPGNAARRRLGSTSRPPSRWRAPSSTLYQPMPPSSSPPSRTGGSSPSPTKLKKGDRPAAAGVRADARHPRRARRKRSAASPAHRFRGGDRATSSSKHRPSGSGRSADWIVANDVSGDVMGGHRNRVHLVTADGVEDWPEASKGRGRATAHRADRGSSRLSRRRGSPDPPGCASLASSASLRRTDGPGPT